MGAFLSLAHQVLELGKELLDGIEIGTVRRQEEEMGAGVADRGAGGFAFAFFSLGLAAQWPTSEVGYFVICKNSIGAPASSMKATRTPSDGSFGLIIMFFPRIAASRSSTSNATCETVFTKSGNGQSSSNLIHCTAYGVAR